MAEDSAAKQEAKRRRMILGVLTGIMALMALWLNVFDRATGDTYAALQSGSVRMTAVLAVLWLALPDTTKGPGVWIFLGALVFAVAMLSRAGKLGFKAVIPLIAILSALAFLRKFTSALTGKPR
ncbi:MAG: hypothetical protein K8U03_04720 [Planctomycetia bacterium]|nr:hypothetical protein [Planctomycetia bacterium]